MSAFLFIATIFNSQIIEQELNQRVVIETFILNPILVQTFESFLYYYRATTYTIIYALLFVMQNNLIIQGDKWHKVLPFQLVHLLKYQSL